MFSSLGVETQADIELKLHYVVKGMESVQIERAAGRSDEYPNLWVAALSKSPPGPEITQIIKTLARGWTAQQREAIRTEMKKAGLGEKSLYAVPYGIDGEEHFVFDYSEALRFYGSGLTTPATSVAPATGSKLASVLQGAAIVAPEVPLPVLSKNTWLLIGGLFLALILLRKRR